MLDIITLQKLIFFYFCKKGLVECNSVMTYIEFLRLQFLTVAAIMDF